jgi:hypothetical protein
MVWLLQSSRGSCSCYESFAVVLIASVVVVVRPLRSLLLTLRKMNGLEKGQADMYSTMYMS